MKGFIGVEDPYKALKRFIRAETPIMPLWRYEDLGALIRTLSALEGFEDPIETLSNVQEPIRPLRASRASGHLNRL